MSAALCGQVARPNRGRYRGLVDRGQVVLMPTLVDKHFYRTGQLPCVGIEPTSGSARCGRRGGADRRVDRRC
jgi:hypothetical protein